MFRKGSTFPQYTRSISAAKDGSSDYRTSEEPSRLSKYYDEIFQTVKPKSSVRKSFEPTYTDFETLEDLDHSPDTVSHIDYSASDSSHTVQVEGLEVHPTMNMRKQDSVDADSVKPSHARALPPPMSEYDYSHHDIDFEPELFRGNKRSRTLKSHTQNQSRMVTDQTLNTIAEVMKTSPTKSQFTSSSKNKVEAPSHNKSRVNTSTTSKSWIDSETDSAIVKKIESSSLPTNLQSDYTHQAKAENVRGKNFTLVISSNETIDFDDIDKPRSFLHNEAHDTGFYKRNSEIDFDKEINASSPTNLINTIITPSNAFDSNNQTRLEELRNRLSGIESEIFSLNNNVKFNVNAPRQASRALFGVETESTDKDTLEALASMSGSRINRMAALLLDYRKLFRQLKKIESTAVSKLDKVGTSNGNKTSNFVPSTDDFKNNPDLEDRNETSDYTTRVFLPNEADPLMLVDASAYIFRAYYSMPPLHLMDGTPVGAVLGFCNMLNRLVLDRFLQGDRPRIVLVFDSKDGATFRKIMYPAYKANRPPCPIDLIPQFDLIKDAADAYGIIKVESPGNEADDVIATLATKAQREGCCVKIFSGDKDLMQLVTLDDSITMVDPLSMNLITHSVVRAKWGVSPDKLGDVLALAGDSSDNIPGVPKIGPKIAASLINEYGSIDELLLNLNSIKQQSRRENIMNNIDSLQLSRKLVTLERSIPVQNMTSSSTFTCVSDLRMEKRTDSTDERLLRFCRNMNLRDLEKRIRERIDQSRGNRNEHDERNHLNMPMDHQSEEMSPLLNQMNIRKISLTSSRPKSPPQAMDYDDVPF